MLAYLFRSVYNFPERCDPKLCIVYLLVQGYRFCELNGENTHGPNSIDLEANWKN